MAKLLDLRHSPTDHHSSAMATRTEISWQGQLFLHQPDRRAVWVATVILWLIAVLGQWFQGNLITTIFFALLGAMLLLHAYQRPKFGAISINALGIQIGDRRYDYKEIKSFWVDYQPDYDIKELSLQLKKWYLPYIKIPIGQANPVQIRSFLLQFIPEIEHAEGLADTIARRLGL